MTRLLEEVAFRDQRRAAEHLARLASELPEGAQSRLAVLLAASADPDRALHHLSRLRDERPAAFSQLWRSPTGLQYLVTIFSHSQFLSEEIIKHPECAWKLPGSADLHRVLMPEEYAAALDEELGPETSGPPAPLALTLFRRRQILRILLRDLLGYGTLSDITEELSNLADALLEVACRRLRADLERRHGTPFWHDPAAGKSVPAGFAIIALGKLGGRELNYSSDIDLMFVYSGAGETSAAGPVSNEEFFKKLAAQLTDLLSAYTPEGLCYRVDLRLRPEGRLGEVCISLDGARSYYQQRARDWELQMLIKARVAAGDLDPGRRLLELVEPLIYSTTLDFSTVEAVSESRERLSEKLARKRASRAGFDVKLARGGIRDIEFLVQCLQRLHGGREPWVRHAGTLLALFRLRNKGLLSDTEYSRLAGAYQFLRHLEHRLQVDQDRQTHTLPSAAEDLELLARRMPASQLGGEVSGDRLMRQLQSHLAEVEVIYERVIHAQRPEYYSLGAAAAEETPRAPRPEAPPAASEPLSSNLIRSLDQKAPNLAATLAHVSLDRSRNAFEHFLERMLPSPLWLSWLDEDAVLAGYCIDLFQHSPFFAEQLIRKPELIEELRQLRLTPQRASRYGEMPPLMADPAELRRFFHREMLRIQSESICLHSPIFTTLERTSALADCIIASAYRMAVDHVVQNQPPASASYAPEGQLMVIALGRLGMQEFDLGSDADLIFVLPDTDAGEHLFWTRVAAHMVDIITAYTGEGVIFAVDPRLRPNGREGPLVQFEGHYKDYFSKSAEAWEGITYMKSRAVAGNTDRATDFLHELQELDWRRYGQSGRSQRKLRQMRLRLENEQGASNPLKAGPGGYYDIDFALMYLRLKGAGMFFKVLNTPARIDIVEKMGHLDRSDADFLRDAATFYGAVDHGIRLISGHAEGNLPSSPWHLEMLTKLVARWTPDHLHDQPLPRELAQIRERTREFYDRLFADRA